MAANGGKAKQNEKKKYSISNVNLQVLGSGAEGAPSSLFVFTDPCRYLFNCGEGTQRLAFEHKVKISKIEHIFVTSKSWKNVGGILGMILTLQDTGIAEVYIHGPKGMKTIFEECKQFAQVQLIKVHFLEHEDVANIIEESDIKLFIKAVPIKPLTQQNKNESTLSESCEDPPLKKQKTMQENCDIALAYICKTPSLPGRLLIEKCKELNVPSGPLLGILKSGQDVTLSCGKIVKASDVTQPDDPGKYFTVVDVPTTHHLNSIIDNKAFEPFQNNTKHTESIVHFSPSDIVKLPAYQQWIHSFPHTVKHIMINEASTCLGLETPHKLQYKLNLLDKHIFPLLKDDSIVINDKEINGDGHCDSNINNNDIVNGLKSDGEKFNGYEDGLKLNDNVVQAVTAMCFQIRPSSKFDRSKVPVLTPKTYHAECFEEEGFKEALDLAHSNMVKLKNEVDAENGSRNNTYPNILFLGTGSCIPNKSRNTSGILIHCSESKCLLLDCGEGTYGQIIRNYGLAKTKEVLRNLCAIYISHRHADHHAGLIGILQGRRKSYQEFGAIQVPPLPILIPSRIINFLNSFEENFESINKDFTIVQNTVFLQKNDSWSLSQHKEFYDSIEMDKIETTYVHHCRGSFGVSFYHKLGWKLTYSGDTMPCDKLIEIGKDCDILIHEATMEDGMEKEAKLKTHSTVSQAIDVGISMKAKHIILTHFSQRYARLPMLGKHTESEVGIAFDNMRIFLEDIKKIHFLYPALKTMFADDYEKTKTKFDKKQRNEAIALQENKTDLL